jgi:glycine/serine hydroxymethyltransferase
MIGTMSGTPSGDRPDRRLRSTRPATGELGVAKARRQAKKIRLLPPRKDVSTAVLEASVSVGTSAPEDGHSGKRFEDGQSLVEPLDQGATNRALAGFSATYDSFLAYCGSQANPDIYPVFFKLDDKLPDPASPRRGQRPEKFSAPGIG